MTWAKLLTGNLHSNQHESDWTTPPHYWSHTPGQLLAELQSSSTGLSQGDAERRLQRYGPNVLKAGGQTTTFALLLNQFKSPLVLILDFAAVISVIAGEWPDAAIVLAVVLGSTTLGFVQEQRASNAIEKLRSTLTIKSNVMRDGQSRAVLSEQVVPGDIVLLSAGSLIPADGVIVEANDLFVNQAVLTGEVFPVEKRLVKAAANASLVERVNCVFMGTSVRSGTACVLIVQTAKATVFGQIAERLKLRSPETEFERGVQRFGYLLTRVRVKVCAILRTVSNCGAPSIDGWQHLFVDDITLLTLPQSRRESKQFRDCHRAGQERDEEGPEKANSRILRYGAKRLECSDAMKRC